MDWTQAFAIMGVFIAAFLYMMSRQDSTKKELSEKFERVDEKFDGMNQRFNSLENKVSTLEVEMRTEMRNMNQRLSTIEGYLVPRKVFHFEEPKPPRKDEPKEN